jgi:sialate O-acetylesterase
VADWRGLFGKPELPVVIAQLSGCGKPVPDPQASGWALMREAQRRAALEIPHAGLAVTFDIGEWNDVHSEGKRPVGQRMAWEALRLTGQGGTGLSAVPRTVQPVGVERAGGSLIVSFDTRPDCRLLAEGANPSDEPPIGPRTIPLRRFTVAGKDGVFHAAQAYVSDRDKVVVWCDEVREPVRVRYAWADSPDGANLMSGLPLMPVTPFETSL